MDAAEHTCRFGTANPVLQEARIHHDPHDQFAWVQDWRFAIAQYLTDQGEFVPDFRGADDIRDDMAYHCLKSLAPNTDELNYAARILERFREWLRVAGKDY